MLLLETVLNLYFYNFDKFEKQDFHHDFAI